MKKISVLLITLFSLSTLGACKKKCDHDSVVIDKGIAATCTKHGLSEGSHCEICGEVIVPQEIIEPLGHEIVIDDAVAATCTEDGLTSGAHCERCEEVFAIQQVIEHIGHKVVTDEAVEPTCTEHGLTEGTHCETCGEIITPQEVIEPVGHHIVIDPAVLATCTEDGLSAGAHCSVCNEVIVSQEIIKHAGHKVVADEAKAPTCTEPGLTEGSHCETCGEVIVSQQPVAPHHDWKYSATDTQSMNCAICGKHSLPIINIESSSTIVKDDYVTTSVSVQSGKSEYDIDSAKCKVKIRGNYTSNLPKKPYRLKFDKKQGMLGLNGGLKAKSWVLLAEYNGYLVKNMMAFNLAKEIMGEDYYSSDFSFVELMINGVEQGVYLLAEQNQVNTGRVEITEPEDGSPDVNIGYLVEMDAYYQTEDYSFSIDYKHDLPTQDDGVVTTGSFEPHYTFKNDIYDNAQIEHIQKIIQNTYDVLYDTLHGDHSDLILNPYKTLDENYNIVDATSILSQKEAIQEVIDYDSFLRMFMLQEIIENDDVGFSSFYLTFDDGDSGDKKLIFQVPWDFDFGFGSNGVNTPTNYLFLLTKSVFVHDYINPWFLLFAKADWFIDDLKTMWSSVLSSNIIEKTITKTQLFKDENIVQIYNNFNKWPHSFDGSTYEMLEFDAKYQTYLNGIFDYLLTKKSILNNILV